MSKAELAAPSALTFYALTAMNAGRRVARQPVTHCVHPGLAYVRRNPGRNALERRFGETTLTQV